MGAACRAKLPRHMHRERAEQPKGAKPIECAANLCLADEDDEEQAQDEHKQSRDKD